MEEEEEKTGVSGDEKEEGTETRGGGSEEDEEDDLFGSDVSSDDSDQESATQAPTQLPSQLGNGSLSEDDDESGKEEKDDKGKGKESDDDDLLPDDDDLFGSDDDAAEAAPKTLSDGEIEKVFTDVIPRPQEGSSLLFFDKPKSLDFEQTPFTEPRFLEEVDPLAPFQPNVVRWRYRETSDGEIVPQTNANIVRFGDGSMYLFIGKRPVGTFGERHRAQPNSYLYSHSINHLVSIGRMKNYCFYPIAQRGRRGRVIQTATRGADPTPLSGKTVKLISTDSEFLKQEDEPSKESRKQRDKLLDRQNKYAQRTDFMGSFLEKGARDEDSDEGTVLARRYDDSGDDVSSEEEEETISYREAFRAKQKKKDKRKRREYEDDSPEEEEAPSFLDDDDDDGYIVPRKKKKRRVIADDDDE